MIDLIIVVTLSLVLIPLVGYSSGVLRIVLGLVFTLFIPGYSLIAALSPRKSTIGSVERVALSFGLSIAIVPIIGLLLSYTPWGISVMPILISVLVFIIVTSAVAWFRRRRFPPEEQFHIRFQFKLDSLSRLWVGKGLLDSVIRILLIIAIAGAIGTLVYVVNMPDSGEKFTEFYILGSEGKTEDYPREVSPEENVTVILGIVSHEYQRTSYRIEIAADEDALDYTELIILGHEERWEEQVDFSLTSVGDIQKIEFLLFKDEATEPYRSLYLWVNVADS